jgi:hypothetical protein
MRKFVMCWPAPAAAAGIVLALGVLASPAQASPAAQGSRAAVRQPVAATTAAVSPGALPAGVHAACPPSKTPGVASCDALTSAVSTAAGKSNAAAAAANPPGLTPSQLQAAYGLQSATEGSRQTVAIVVGSIDPSAPGDLTTYRSQYGLPACTTGNGCFSVVDLAPVTAVADPGWVQETSLDMDVVSAICPNCHIMLVEAAEKDIPDLGQGVDTAVSDGAKFIDNSYSTSETSLEIQDDYDAYYNHPGVVETAAAGDGGYGVSFPASSPYVTAVGGTVLTSNSSAVRGWSETADPDAGAGCSAYETAKPTWQADTGCTARTDNDVAAIDNSTVPDVPYYDDYNGAPGWQLGAGTSVSASAIAAVYALAGTPSAGSNPASYPYSHPKTLNDVTTGTDVTNGACSVTYLCTAGPGYDGPTGLGTPGSVIPFTASGTLPGVFYNGSGGMCMDDSDNAATAGNKVQIWKCNGNASQHWTAESDGTIQHSGLCLGLANGTTTAQTPVWLYTCDAATSQKWIPAGNGELKNVAANLCLGVTNGTIANGTQLWIYNCDGDASQTWQLPYAVPTGTGPVTSQAAPGECIGLQNGSTSDGTALWLYTCAGTSTQNWTVEANGTLEDAGKCMDVKGSGTANDTTVDLYTCNGQANQQWVVRSDGSLMNPASGRCLGLNGGSTTPSTTLWIYDCDAQATQSWTLPS